MAKSISGKQAVLYSAAKGALIEGTGSVALANESWFMIAGIKAVGSELPIQKLGAIFKTGATAHAITPAVGDNVYPLTLSQICKGDLSVSGTKGTIDVTDDCEGPYNAYIVDGFTDLSGSFNSFLKFNDPAGGIAATQKAILSRFMDIVDDSGAGSYVVTDANDDDLILQVLLDSAPATVGLVQSWMNIPCILTGVTMDKPLKGVQNFDITWQKAQGHAAVYQRTLIAGDIPA